jgi:Fe-S-cluster containining protein
MAKQPVAARRPAPAMEHVRFACERGCINCCTQEGLIHLTEDDLVRAARFVGMSPAAFEKKYVVRSRHELRFRKPRKKQCPFLLDHGCSIHPAKPTQCRTFPFWPELLEREVEWKEAATYCPGIGQGPLIQIAAAMEIAEEQRKAYPSQYIVE